MIAIISLAIPPLILVYLREKLMGVYHTAYKKALIYAFSVLGLNFIMLVTLYFVFGSRKELFYRLNTYNGFAIKYMLLSVVLAAIEPCAEMFLRKRVRVAIDFRGGGKRPLGHALAGGSCHLCYCAFLFKFYQDI